MKERTDLQILAEHMEGLSTMIDASSQMVHQFGNIKFMAVRDMLSIIKDSIANQVVQKG